MRSWGFIHFAVLLNVASVVFSQTITSSASSSAIAGTSIPASSVPSSSSAPGSLSPPVSSAPASSSPATTFTSSIPDSSPATTSTPSVSTSSSPGTTVMSSVPVSSSPATTLTSSIPASSSPVTTSGSATSSFSATTTTTSVPTAPPSGTPTPSFEINPNGNITKCLSVQGGTVENGTLVQIHDCNGTTTPNWIIAPGEGHVQLAGTNQCLDAGDSPAYGTEMKIRECTDDSRAQDWFYTDDQRIALTNQGFCLDLTDGILKNGNTMQLWKCTDFNTNQIWTVSNGTSGPQSA